MTPLSQARLTQLTQLTLRSNAASGARPYAHAAAPG